MGRQRNQNDHDSGILFELARIRLNYPICTEDSVAPLGTDSLPVPDCYIQCPLIRDYHRQNLVSAAPPAEPIRSLSRSHFQRMSCQEFAQRPASVLFTAILGVCGQTFFRIATSFVVLREPTDLFKASHLRSRGATQTQSHSMFSFRSLKHQKL